MEDWQRWTFSDECSIELDCAEGIQRFIIRRDQRYNREFVTGKRQAGGGKLMIWSRISYDERGPLLFIEGGIDSQVYIDILENNVLDHCLERIGDDGRVHLYQDDGATCHDSDAVINYCAEKGIQRPYWPASSPDMNPIEHIWGWIKFKLTKLKAKPRNVAELKRVVTRVWEEISLESIQKLYDSMPKRIRELQRVQGANTKF